MACWLRPMQHPPEFKTIKPERPLICARQAASKKAPVTSKFACLRNLNNMRLVSLCLVLIFFSSPSVADDVYWDLDVVLSRSKDAGAVNLVTTGAFQRQVTHSYLSKLGEIKNRISNQANVYPKFLISSSEDANAFATWINGQPVAIFTFGLLDRLGGDYDAIAGVVGHEVAHLKLRHSASRETVGFLVNLLAGLALIAIDSSHGGAAYNPNRELYRAGLNIGSTLVMNGYTRSEEIDADSLGVRYLMASGYSAEGVIRMHETILAANSSFFSTHPSSSDRIKNIKKIVMAHVDSMHVGSPSEINSGSGNTALLDISKDYQKKSHLIAQTNCIEKKIDPKSSKFDVCVFHEVRQLAVKSAQTSRNDSLETPERSSGQIGTILHVDEKNRHIIFSSAISHQLPPNYKILIESNGATVNGAVLRFFDGYYLAEVDAVQNIAVGGQVQFK